MNKLLFLDFDGVLHPTHFAAEEPLSRVSLLEAVLVENAPQIVISSSWRFTHSLEKLQKMLPKTIVDLIIGTTGEPVIGKHPRYHEILTYIQSHGPCNWRALDDSYWEFPPNCQELIRCNPNTGIGQREIDNLQRWVCLLS